MLLVGVKEQLANVLNIIPKQTTTTDVLKWVENLQFLLPIAHTLRYFPLGIEEGSDENAGGRHVQVEQSNSNIGTCRRNLPFLEDSSKSNKRSGVDTFKCKVNGLKIVIHYELKLLFTYAELFQEMGNIVAEDAVDRKEECKDLLGAEFESVGRLEAILQANQPFGSAGLSARH